jgi:DNA-binding transcriptional LysR family regulator
LLGVEIRQLELFLAVAEHRNFTRAAERMHTVQSAVSASVKGLEQELGLDLFRRSSRSVDLTAAGEALLLPARKALAAVDEAHDVAASFHGAVRGSVSLGMLAARDFLDVPKALADFRRAYPDVTVTARTSPTGGIGLLADLVDETLDVSLLVLPLQPHPDVETEPLVGGRLLLAVADSDPLAGSHIDASALDGREFVMLARGFSLRTTLDGWLASQGIRYSLTIEIADQALVANYVREGLGVGLIAEHEIMATPGLSPVYVEGFAPTFSVAIGTKRGRHMSSATQALIDVLRSRARSADGLKLGLASLA